MEGKDSSFESVDIFFNFLLDQGYLSVVDVRTTDDEGIKVEVKIPNQEIKLEFIEKLKLFYKRVYRINFDILKGCSSAFDQFGFSNEENKEYVSELFEKLNELFKTITFDIINEATFHHVFYLVALYCKGKCYSEIYCPRRNPNILDLIIFYGNGISIIIELKIDEAIVKGRNDIKYADAGLYQILDKKYVSGFKNEKYNPNKIDIKYYVLMGVHIKSADKSISLSVLLNNCDYNNKINFLEM